MSDLNPLVDQLRAMTVEDAAELSKLLEEKWGVSAAAAIGKMDFGVVLTGVGSNKADLLREIRAITGLAPAEALILVEGVPAVVKSDLSLDEAEDVRRRLKSAGAQAETANIVTKPLLATQPMETGYPAPAPAAASAEPLRLMVLVLIGVALAYLFGPISPIVGAARWGLIAVAIIPLLGLGAALIKTAQG